MGLVFSGYLFACSSYSEVVTPCLLGSCLSWLLSCEARVRLPVCLVQLKGQHQPAVSVVSPFLHPGLSLMTARCAFGPVSVSAVMPMGSHLHGFIPPSSLLRLGWCV